MNDEDGEPIEDRVCKSFMDAAKKLKKKKPTPTRNIGLGIKINGNTQPAAPLRSPEKKREGRKRNMNQISNMECTVMELSDVPNRIME